ncbi:MAG: Nif11-like leader peptide family natural product precursor [Synergistaceae bacterium]|nr:Nif11-like leader peptide family natural product precursor [Synergistaceae bacterium]
MSQEKAQEFIRRVGTEKFFSNMLDNVKSRDNLLDVAKSLGYEFTVEELRLAIVRIMDLDEADLDSVMGGAQMFGYGKALSLVNLLGMQNAE